MTDTTTTQKPIEIAPGAAITRDSRYAWFVTILLTATFSLSFIDRQVLNLLVEPIKSDFQLTDSQVSLIQGLAFTSAYVLMGPFFGRWVDIGNRRNIIVFGAVLWSTFTVVSGLSRNYGELFGARMGVGAAEACLFPAVFSLLPDYFRKETLPRAMSIYLMSPYIGGGLALIFGGLVLQAANVGVTADLPLIGTLDDWQLVFIAVGTPGILLAFLLFTIAEPRRHADAKLDHVERFTLRDVLSFFWTNRILYGCFFGGMSLHVIILYAMPAWVPSFLFRRFDVGLDTIGLQYGALVLVAGMIGVLSGPVLNRWLANRGYTDAPFRVPVLSGIALILACGILPLAPSYEVALIVLVVVTFLVALPLAMASTALLMITPNRMRGLAASVYVFTTSVVGLGFAPTIIALVTDYVFQDPGKVGVSLAMVCSAAGLGTALVMGRGMAPFRAALSEEN